MSATAAVSLRLPCRGREYAQPTRRVVRSALRLQARRHGPHVPCRRCPILCFMDTEEKGLGLHEVRRLSKSKPEKLGVTPQVRTHGCGMARRNFWRGAVLIRENVRGRPRTSPTRQHTMAGSRSSERPLRIKLAPSCPSWTSICKDSSCLTCSVFCSDRTSPS
eukprot:scaffold3990_cov394-Prasinococcus_capsulatus_cf.AAC.6